MLISTFSCALPNQQSRAKARVTSHDGDMLENTVVGQTILLFCFFGAVLLLNFYNFCVRRWQYRGTGVKTINYCHICVTTPGEFTRTRTLSLLNFPYCIEKSASSVSSASSRGGYTMRRPLNRDQMRPHIYNRDLLPKMLFQLR